MHEPPVARRPRRLAFVDGTMRVEARLTRTDQGATKPYVVRHNDREDIYVRAGQHVPARHARTAGAAVRDRRA